MAVRGTIANYTHAKLKKVINDANAAANVGGSDTHVQYNNGGSIGGASSLLYNDTSGDFTLIDDKKLYFGTNSDAYVEYNENGDDFLTISGSAKGIVLSGSTIQIAGTLEGASPLKIGGELQFVSSGSAAAFNFGPNKEAKIYYESDGFLTISGSSAKGTAISGSSLMVGTKIGVGVPFAEATHGITLPNLNSDLGQIKANAFVSYSSRRYKENVQELENPLKVIQSLQGVSYTWKESGNKDYGFIAEEVGKTLPGIVQWEDNGKDAIGMDYLKVISFLVEAVKEQQTQIEKLNQQLINRSENTEKK